MSKILIASNPTIKKPTPDNEDFINVSEFFFDTIQGENFVGWPSAFLRVQNCTQNCIFCDSTAVWRYGNPYIYEELLDMIESSGLKEKLKEGQHLVFTGGSPLYQQNKLIELMKRFVQRFSFKPYVEVENEATLIPKQELIDIVDLWNNSPKLANSLNSYGFRYQPKIISILASLNNSWFKFVVSCEEDWQEIKKDFIDTNLIKRNQIVLMPLGATREELFQNREIVLEIAVRETVRYSTREHIAVWNKKIGV